MKCSADAKAAAPDQGSNPSKIIWSAQARAGIKSFCERTVQVMTGIPTAYPAEHRDGMREIAKIPRQEIRPREWKVPKIREALRVAPAEARPFFVVVACLRDEAQRTVRRPGAQMDKDGRIEAFEANRPRIGGDSRKGTVGETHIAIIAAFDLDDDRHAAADAARENPTTRRFSDRNLYTPSGRARRAKRIDAAFRPHQTVEGEIVEHHGFAIFCALDVAFDRIVLGDRGGGRGGRIFDQSELFGMKTPVCDRPRRQPVRRIYRNGLSSARDLEQGLDLDRAVQWQFSDADRRSCVAALIAQDLDDKIRRAIHDACEIGKTRRRVDESAEPDAARNLVEIAQGRLGLRENIDGA